MNNDYDKRKNDNHKGNNDNNNDPLESRKEEKNKNITGKKQQQEPSKDILMLRDFPRINMSRVDRGENVECSILQMFNIKRITQNI